MFRLGLFSVETPEAWAVACLPLFVIFMPIYAIGRPPEMADSPPEHRTRLDMRA